MKAFLRQALQKRIIANAFKIALVVGGVLNAINQGPAILAGTRVSLPHLLLNFLVPFCVATYSAVKNEQTRGNDP